MPRHYNGHFARAPVVLVEGIGVCPWCRSFTFRPELPGPFIDPSDMAARVCRCGYDSRRGRVSANDFHRLLARVDRASAEHIAAAYDTRDPDPEAVAILDYQLTREIRRAEALVWLVGPLREP